MLFNRRGVVLASWVRVLSSRWSYVIVGPLRHSNGTRLRGPITEVQPGTRGIRDQMTDKPDRLLAEVVKGAWQSQELDRMRGYDAVACDGCDGIVWRTDRRVGSWLSVGQAIAGAVAVHLQSQSRTR